MATPQDRLPDLNAFADPPAPPKKTRPASDGLPNLDAFAEPAPVARAPKTPRAPAAPSSTAPRPSFSPRVQSKIDAMLADLTGRGLDVRLDSGSLRTPQEQAEKVRLGYSKTYNSKHLTGNAADFVVYENGKDQWKNPKHPHWRVIGEVAKAHGAKRWGGDFSSFYDPAHVEFGDEDEDAPASSLPNLERFADAPDPLSPDAPLANRAHAEPARELRRRGTREEVGEFASQMSPQLDALGVGNVLHEETGHSRERSRVEGAPVDDEVERVNSVPASRGVAPAVQKLPTSAPLDPYSTEDRERRDVAAAARVRAVTLPLARSLADYNDASELMADAYRHGARSLNIPSGFVEDWIKSHPDHLQIVDSNPNSTTKYTPADLLGSSVHNERGNTVRLNLGGLSDLERDYRAWRSTASRFVDWATDDTTTAGEKATSAASAALRPLGTLSTAAAGLQRSVSTSIGALAGDEESQKVLDADIYSPVNIVKATWERFKTGNVPEGFEQPIAKGLDLLYQKKNKMPLPEWRRMALEIIGDPMNYGALNLAGVAVDAVKGTNAGRRLFQPSGLTVLDIERAADDGGHYLVKLKDANGAEHVIDTSAYYANGQKPKLKSVPAGRDIEGVGLERDGDTGRIYLDGKPQDLVMDSDGTLRAAPVGGYKPAAAPESIPETPETLAAQVEAMRAGRRPVVVVTPDALRDVSQKVIVPKGMRSFGTPEGGRIIYNPALVDRDDVVRRMDDGTLGELLGHVEPKSGATTHAVVARDARTGGEVQSSAVSPENVDAQVEEFRRQYPDAEIEAGGADLAARVLDERVGGNAPARLVSDEVLRPEKSLGRDVVIVERADGTRQAFYRSSGQNSGQPGEWFPFGGVVDGGEYDGWFNKAPYVRDELSDTAHPLHRYGTEENREIGQWLKSQNLPDGVEVPRAELNARLLDAGAFDDATDRYSRFTAPASAAPAGDDPFADITPAQVTPTPAATPDLSNLADAPDDEWRQFAPETRTLGIPRATMPQVKGEHRGALVQFLKGRGISHTQTEIAPSALKPSQAEFSPSKVNKARGFEGKPRSILISSDGHVLDGHHQWLSALHDAPDAPIPAIQLDAPIQQLLIETARFPSSGVDDGAKAISKAGAASGDEIDELLRDVRDDPNIAETIPVNPNPRRRRLGAALEALTPPQFVRRAAREIRDVVNVTKAIPASFDNSALFGQGAIISGARPSLIPSAVADSARSAMSRTKFEAFKKNLVTHPDQQLREDSGLYLASIGQGEETFGSRFADRIPGVAASQRAYEATLDSLRSNAADLYFDELKRAGLTFETDPKAFRDVARWINVATGRGELGRLEPLADVLNLPMFSPRLLASKFNIISPVRYARMHPAARKIALREMFRATGSLGVTMGLAKLAGADVDLDPFSAGFGTIEADGTSYDLSGGRIRALRVAAQLADSLNRERRGETVKDNRKPAVLVERFFRAYLSPAGQLSADYLTGEDFEGNAFGSKEWKPGEMRFGELDRLMPFAVKEIRDAYHKAGVVGAVKAAPTFVGVGVHTKDKSFEPREPLLSERNQRVLDALGVDLEHMGKKGKRNLTVRPGRSVEGVTGDSITPHGDTEKYNGGMGMSPEKFNEELSAELNRVIDEEVDSPDWDTMTNEERARRLDVVLVNTEKRMYNPVRRDARFMQQDEEKKVQQRLDRMGAGSKDKMHFQL
ncbi:MAG TPA: M15 family metallopeptidase [Pyrinomonadaceae bacterium]|nr:M15 family metallopeptidase [Pyrinomonadaceae bacterium]